MSNFYHHSEPYDERHDPQRRPRLQLNVPPAPFYPSQSSPASNWSNRKPTNDRQYSVPITREEANNSEQTVSVSPVRLVCDIILVAVAWIPVVLLNTIAKPFRRGFFCDDESIRYPYFDDTVTRLALYLGGAAVVAAVVIVVEAIVVYWLAPNEQPTYIVAGKRIPVYLSSLYIYVGYCVVGALFVQTATDICKNMVGRHRPHYITVCQPDWSKVNCTGHNYILEPHCQSTDHKRLNNAIMSFLSGHSSYSAYMMFYAAMYMQARLSRSNSGYFIRYFVQFGLIMLAVFVALSRISDYKHHWSDVLAGMALGIATACITVLHVGHLFRRQSRCDWNQQRKHENDLL